MNTLSSAALQDYGNTPWRPNVRATTLLRQMADLQRGERLRELRDRRGLSQEEVAGELGVTAKTYWTWESKGGEISIPNQKKLAAFFEVERDYIMRGDQPQGVPDLMEQLNGDRIGQLEARLEKLEALTRSIAQAVGAEEPPSRFEEEADRAAREVRTRPPKRRRTA